MSDKERLIRTEVTKYLSTRQPNGDIEKGKAVICVDRMGTVPWGTVGKVTNISDNTFACVNWLGTHPSGKPWHRSDKDMTIDMIQLFQPHEHYDLNRIHLLDLLSLYEKMKSVTNDRRAKTYSLEELSQALPQKTSRSAKRAM